MTIPIGTGVEVTIPNAYVAKYDPETDRYFVHSPAFYGGAWIKAENVDGPDPDIRRCMIRNNATGTIAPGFPLAS